MSKAYDHIICRLTKQRIPTKAKKVGINASNKRSKSTPKKSKKYRENKPKTKQCWDQSGGIRHPVTLNFHQSDPPPVCCLSVLLINPTAAKAD